MRGQHITIDDVKAWLKRGQYLMREIEALKESKREAMLRATSITVGEHKERVSRSADKRSDDALIAIADYSLDVDRRVAKLQGVLTEISSAIYSVEDGLLRLLLINRYILFHNWEQVSINIGQEYRWTHRLHRRALGEIYEILNFDH